MYIIVMMKTGRPNARDNKKDLFHLKWENNTSNWLLPNNQVRFYTVSGRKCKVKVKKVKTKNCLDIFPVNSQPLHYNVGFISHHCTSTFPIDDIK